MKRKPQALTPIEIAAANHRRAALEYAAVYMTGSTKDELRAIAELHKRAIEYANAVRIPGRGDF